MGAPFLRSGQLTPEKLRPNSLIAQASHMVFRFRIPVFYCRILLCYLDENPTELEVREPGFEPQLQ